MTSNARVAQSLRDRKNRFRTRVRQLRRMTRYRAFRVSMTTSGLSTAAMLQAMTFEGQWRNVRPLKAFEESGTFMVFHTPSIYSTFQLPEVSYSPPTITVTGYHAQRFEQKEERSDANK